MTQQDKTDTRKEWEIVRLPRFPKERRPVSNDMARGALFACVQGKDREVVKEMRLATVEGIEIRFTGERFNQDDHDVLMQIVHMAAAQPLGDPVTIPAHTLLKALGRGTGKSQHEQLRSDIIRLRAGTVFLRNARTQSEYIGGFIDDAMQDQESGHWIIRLNEKLKLLYGEFNHTLIDWEKRKALRGKDLARWLSGYLTTNASQYPVKVDTLCTLSGSKTRQLFKFRQRLRVALQDLVKNGDIAEWSIDPVSDLVTVSRGDSITSSQRRHLDKKSQ